MQRSGRIRYVTGRIHLRRVALDALVALLALVVILGGAGMAWGAYLSASRLTPVRAAATLTAQRVATGPPALLVIGDSLTAGLGASQPQATYPSDLARLLATGAWVALGQSGYTTNQMLAALRGVPLPRHLSVAVVELGTNDWAQGRPLAAFAQDYAAMLALVMAPAPQQLVCLSGWPHGEALAARNALNLPMSAYNAVIRRVCQEASSRARFVDLTPIAAIAANHAGGDGYHPNDQGYAAMAQSIAAAVSA